MIEYNVSRISVGAASPVAINAEMRSPLTGLKLMNYIAEAVSKNVGMANHAKCAAQIPTSARMTSIATTTVVIDCFPRETAPPVLKPKNEEVSLAVLTASCACHGTIPFMQVL